MQRFTKTGRVLHLVNTHRMPQNSTPPGKFVISKDSSKLAKLFLGSKHTDWSPRLLRILWALEAGLVGLVGALARLLPPDTASAAGHALLAGLGPRLDKTRQIRRNLKIAFPEKNATETCRLVRAMWGNLGSVLAEYPHLGRICKPGPEQRLDCVLEGDPEVFRKNGKPAVFVTAHLANWELAAGAVVQQGVPLSVVYTKMQNPWMDRLLFRTRKSLGCGLMERDNAARTLLRCLKKGTSIGLLVDQRVDAGEPVPFFGRDMLTSVTPAQLALRFGCELIPIQVQRLHGARFRAIFHKPVVADDENAENAEKILQMTRKINTLFESWIRERPHEWMCTKRRWPKDRKRPDGN
ncbi:MAG: lysophospholipid acyltransferase family protein [Gammaproteobacteria bacterium]|nr:MAG: lysophospholipid acyltransferase family protein [Gammaproteobacteria bacterium]